MRQYRTKSSWSWENRNKRDRRRNYVLAVGRVPDSSYPWPNPEDGDTIGKWFQSQAERGIRIPRSLRRFIKYTSWSLEPKRKFV